jgi:mono/diheme cytochrome c family protein/sugar lactone lactonase YvrE
MSQSKFITVSAILYLICLSLGISLAQDVPPLPGEIAMSGLGSPRGLAFDEDGTLFVADAGAGGEQELTFLIGDTEITKSVGLTGRVVSLTADGTKSDAIIGLPSYSGSAGRYDGLYRVIPNGDSLWLIFNGNGKRTFGAYWTNSIVEIDATTLATRGIINLDSFEQANDPDGNGFDTNVGDIAWTPDDEMIIVDIAGNSLLSWTEADGLQVITAWSDNSVPTSVEIADNGDIYVGFLGQGMAADVAKIERWSNSELVETFEGLTAVTDILLDGDRLYAVEFVTYDGDEAGAGRIVQVSSEGITQVVGGIIAPFAIAKGNDGALYVTYSTVTFVQGLSGGVLKFVPSESESVAPSTDSTSTETNALDSNIENGRELFRSGKGDAQRCANCHRVTTRGFAVDAGPNLEWISQVAGTRVEGMSAEEYLKDSIINPLNHIVDIYRTPMPEDYASLLTAQDIDDLVAYMMQLTAN